MNAAIAVEMLGTTPNATILSIGAVVFNDHLTTDEFYRTTDWESGRDMGRAYSLPALQWLRRHGEPRLLEGQVPLPCALSELADFVGQARPTLVYLPYPSLDARILDSAYQQAGIPTPWTIQQVRSYAALAAIHGLPDCPHKLSAIEQARHMQRYLRCTMK